jgi:hypothetical protein
LAIRAKVRIPGSTRNPFAIEAASSVRIAAPKVQSIAGDRPDISSTNQKISDIHRSLRDFQLLLHAVRLYDESHPTRMSSLDSAYDSLRETADVFGGLEIRVERGGLVVPKIGDSRLPDFRGEMQSLASELDNAGVKTLHFRRKFHVGDLDTLATLIKASLLKSEETPDRNGYESWPARLLEKRVEGISVNTQTERGVNTVLASLMVSALVAHGGRSSGEPSGSPLRAPSLQDFSDTLRLLARLTPPLEIAHDLTPEEAARALHNALEAASHRSIRMLLDSVSHYAPREAEQPHDYLLRLSEQTVLEFMLAECASGAIAPAGVRSTIERLGDVIVDAGGYSGPQSLQRLSSLAVIWAMETHREKIIERFWTELPAREKSAVLKSEHVWCIPITVLRQSLSQLAAGGADAPRREARTIVLNYSRRLELTDASARRSVAAGLNELTSVIESLWPNQLPPELSQNAMCALEREVTPETAALLAAFVESLGRIAVNRADYAGFETILTALERAPRDKEHDHMTALAYRLVAQDRWLLLADAALANRPLDPVLPRLLQRDPERLLDRMTLLFTEPRAAEMIPAMARLLRAIGVPVLNILEARLYEARRQRVTAAIKLLAAADPDRLLRGLTRAISSWEWNLQDLAVSELCHPASPGTGASTAFVFSSVLSEAHPLVVPLMIDHIGLSQEGTAVQLLMEIAAGAHEILRDQFTRIKAIEALGRMQVLEAVGILRHLAGGREGLVHIEPSGVRAAAEDALALIESRPNSARVRAAYEQAGTSGKNYYGHQRRYVRIPLESPLRAQIEGTQTGLARVKSISLGGAYVESSGKMSVGDTLKLEVRSGLSKINCTAVVRNVGPGGGGVEFVHMRDKDCQRLRQFVRNRLT